MNRYPSYKTSGIDWIGEIPSHWELKKVKYKGKTLAGGTPATGISEYWDGDIPWLNSGKVQNNIIHFSDVDRYITELGLHESATKMIKPNSVLIALTGATCANIGYLTFPSTANQSVVAIENDSTLYSKYLYYYLLSQREQILIERTGGAQSGINEGDVKNLLLCFPPKEEQTAIANYLDEKTTQIDKLISNKQKLIELFKEERTAIINEAVSGKGKNWERKKLKYVAKINSETLSEKENDNLQINYIDISSVDENGKINSTSSYLYSDAPSRARRIVRNGDTILSTVRTYLKAIAFIENAIENLICSTGFAIIRPSEKLNKQFLFLNCRSQKFIDSIMSLSKGVSYPSIDSEDVKNMEIKFPTIKEQTDIVQHIQTETQRIDNTISKIEKEIELMQEYRTALISEVVTGKVKVC